MDLGQRYLEVVLRFGRLEPSLVESYVGPPELAARVDAEPMPLPGEVSAAAARLRGEVAESRLAAERREWLMVQLAALEVACAWLDGAPLSYRELVERCHGVSPVLVDEAKFAAAHARLDTVLPGRGSLPERYQRWAATQLVPAELVLPGLRALAAELGTRARQMFALPEGEEVVWELVRDTPYGGNAEYLGDLRTRIAINVDLPIRAFDCSTSSPTRSTRAIMPSRSSRRRSWGTPSCWCGHIRPPRP